MVVTLPEQLVRLIRREMQAAEEARRAPPGPVEA
jgi:hypothetical protein